MCTLYIVYGILFSQTIIRFWLRLNTQHGKKVTWVWVWKRINSIFAVILAFARSSKAFWHFDGSSTLTDNFLTVTKCDFAPRRWQILTSSISQIWFWMISPEPLRVFPHSYLNVVLFWELGKCWCDCSINSQSPSLVIDYSTYTPNVSFWPVSMLIESKTFKEFPWVFHYSHEFVHDIMIFMSLVVISLFFEVSRLSIIQRKYIPEY